MTRLIASLVLAGALIIGPSVAFASEVTGQLSSGGANTVTSSQSEPGSLTGTVTSGTSSNEERGGGGGGTRNRTNNGTVAGASTQAGSGTAIAGTSGGSTSGAGFSNEVNAVVTEGEMPVDETVVAVAGAESPLVAAAASSGFGMGWWLWALLLLLVMAGIYAYRRYYHKPQ